MATRWDLEAVRQKSTLVGTYVNSPRKHGTAHIENKYGVLIRLRTNSYFVRANSFDLIHFQWGATFILGFII
jgi:hypothetical protein